MYGLHSLRGLHGLQSAESAFWGDRCRRHIPILQPRKATPLVQLVLLPPRCEELSLPFLFPHFSFPLLHCSLFEVPFDLISGHICSICVVTALGVRKTQVKGEPDFLCKLSSLFDERLMTLIYYYYYYYYYCYYYYYYYYYYYFGSVR